MTVQRKIVASEWRCDGTHIEFECGHVTKYAAHFSAPPPGQSRPCWHCEKCVLAERRAREDAEWKARTS